METPVLHIVSVESLWSMDINQNVAGATRLSYCKSLCSGEMNCALKTLISLLLTLEGVNVRCQLRMSADTVPWSSSCMSPLHKHGLEQACTKRVTIFGLALSRELCQSAQVRVLQHASG